MIAATIRTEIGTVLREHHSSLPVPTDETLLAQSGLDSLFFAILVTRLEDRLGLDPFTSLDEFDFPLTLGDFIRCYERAAGQACCTASSLDVS